MTTENSTNGPGEWATFNVTPDSTSNRSISEQIKMVQ